MIRNITTSVDYAGIMAISALAQTNTTTAAVTRVAALAMIGIGATEAARVSLTNTATASQAGTVGSCEGSVSFYDAAGHAYWFGE